MTSTERPESKWRKRFRGIAWAVLTVAAVTAAALAANTPFGRARLAVLFDESRAIAAGLASVGSKSDRDALTLLEPSRSLPSLEARIVLMEQQLGELQRRVNKVAAQAVPGNGGASGPQALMVLPPDHGTVTGSLPDNSAGSAQGAMVKTILKPRLAGAESSGSVDVTFEPLQQLTPETNAGSDVSAGFSAVLQEKQRRSPLQPADTAQSQLVNTEFGVALGSAPDIATLEQMWRSLSAAHPEALSALEPRIGIASTAAGKAQLLLIAGPVRNARDAAKLCVVLTAMDKTCETVPFSDATLSLAAIR